MNITKEAAEELYSLGFSYKHYQEDPYKGMVYFFQGREYVIGGDVEDDMTASEQRIIQNGLWLPSEIHLLEWLEDNDFVFCIINVDGFYEIKCKDSRTQTEYKSKTPTLDVALYAVVKKILKKRERVFDTKDKIYGIIEQ